MEKVLSPWEYLAKQMIWQQLGPISGKKILDFGSGNGITANYYAKDNEVIAVEPSTEMLQERYCENSYTQIIGSTQELNYFADESFDLILCHNVLEYAEHREETVREFYRLLKPQGLLSVVKHNRPGRIMQMVVLLNNFAHAELLLDGGNGQTQTFVEIHYYDDEDLLRWCNQFVFTKCYGIRTFWDLQQNQNIQKDSEWQENMLRLEMRVSDIEEYRNIAFFHHLVLKK